MKKTDLHIKKLTLAHIDQYDHLLRYAFQVTEKSLLDYGWDDDEIRQSKFPVLQHANVIGCFDGDMLVSQFAVYPMHMNIHSAIYSIGFVTSVATYPEYSGKGIMSKLMREGLVEMRENRQSLALLYPYSIPLYRKRGWEIVSDKMTWRITDSQLPKEYDASGYVRRVAIDSPDLKELHTHFAKQTHGCLFRNDLAWEEYWRWDVDDITVAIYYNANDIPSGYMVYLVQNDIMTIKEMAYLNKDAKKGLFKYIAAHESMIEEVRCDNYTGETIAFELENGDIKETIRPYIMGRIVDVEQFFAQYKFEPDSDGTTITFDVHDPFLEWNSNSYTLRIENGRGVLTEGQSAHKVSLSIGALTTLLLGYKRAPELANLEKISTSQNTVRLLDSIIIRKKPYLSDYI